ncbi:MAG: glycosyltransferase [Tissierellia bacterium]|nr:glycosyltransferase [Tissierellia bacterium]
MKIIHFATMSGKDYSGVSLIVPEYIKHQSFYCEEILVNCNTKVKYNNNKIETINLSCKSDILKLFNDVTKPDLVIIHEIYNPIYLDIVNFLLKNNIPYVLVPHGGLTKHAQIISWYKKIIGNILLFNKVIKNAIAIQYLSKNEAKQSIINKRYIICGNGFEVKTDKRYYVKQREKFKITYIGRLDPYHKGLDVLIESCKTIKSYMKENNIIIYICGPDYKNQERKLHKLINKYDLNEIVKIKSAMYNEDKIDFLLDSDLFVQTSRLEGQPLSLIEALKLGIPIIVTPGTTFSDIVKEANCGYAVDFNKYSIAEVIIKSHKQRKELLNLSMNAIKVSKNIFEWGDITKNTLRCYYELIGKRFYK